MSFSPIPIQHLLITRSLWAEIESQCASTTLETGGKALGRFFTDGSALACLPIGPGPGALHATSHFAPDLAWQQERHDTLLESFPHARLTLDWHLHPDGPAGLSALDRSSINAMLHPDGWGLEALVFLVVDRAGATLERHAFLAVRAEDGPAEITSITTALIDDDDPRVRRVLEPFPSALRVVVPRELADSIGSALLEDRSDHPANVPLYGYRRLEEELITVVALEPWLDSVPVGRAVRSGVGLPLLDNELRLTLRADGRLDPAFHLDGRTLPARLELPPLSGLPARNQGLAPEGLAQRHVAFVGLGSVGAPIALSLAQAGVGRFTVLDPDTFSIQNLSRHPGDLRDLGRRKDVLVAEKLLARARGARVSRLELDVRDPAHEPELREALGEADLWVVSTDDPVANLAANRLAIGLGVPALFVGIYDGGLGGEVFLRRPDRAGCYNCVAGFRAELPPLPRTERAHDYLDLRPGAELPPLNALAVDIGHVTAIASSVALGILGTRARLEGLIGPESPLLLVANGQAGWIFSRPFEVLTARLEDPGCPVCCPERVEAFLAAASEEPCGRT